MKTLPVAILLTVACFGNLSAQIRCTASVDRRVFEPGETFTLSVEIVGRDAGVESYPQLPRLEGLEAVYANAGESTSISVVNGKTTVTKTFQYLLKAVAVGKWSIPPIKVDVAGSTYQTQALSIEVVPPGTTKPVDDLSDDVFLALVPDRTEAYIGEAIEVALKIFTRVNITQYSARRLPSFVGFWAQEFEMPRTPEPKNETVNGISYRVYTIKRTALFPTRSGSLTLDGAEIECDLRVARKGRGGIFDDFFSPFADPFGKVMTTRLTAPPINIQVKELPIDSKPSGFSGLVGQFDVVSTVDKTVLKTGDALTYRLIIRGSGNIMASATPPAPFSDDFEQYDPKVDLKLGSTGERITGTKTVDFIAIPRAPRIFEIPSFELIYFDPTVKRYVSKLAPGHKLDIAPGLTSSSGSNLSKEEVTLLSRDIRFIKTGRSSWVTPTSWLWPVAWFLPGVGIAGGLLYSRRRRLSMKNPEGERYRRASPIARTGLRKAEHLMKTEQHDRFYAEMSRILSGFVQDKLALSGPAVLREEIVRHLNSRNVSQTTILEFTSCLDACDEARFSPDRNNRHRMEEIHTRVREVIYSLDGSL